MGQMGGQGIKEDDTARVPEGAEGKEYSHAC